MSDTAASSLIENDCAEQPIVSDKSSIDAPVSSETDASAASSELERQLQTLSVPGYEVSQDGVFTVIKRTAAKGRSDTFPARIYRWLINSDKWFPYMWRFIKESIALSPWRMGILLLSKLMTSLAPAARLWITSKMLMQVEQAVSTGTVNRYTLGGLALLGSILGTGFRSLEIFFGRNAGILERYFEAMVTSRLLQAYSKLDYLAAKSPENSRIFTIAARTVNSNSEQAFTIVADVVKTFTSALDVVSQAYILRQTLTRTNADLIAIGFVANFIRSAEWLFRGDAGIRSATTNPHYHRMQSLWNQAWMSEVAEHQLLGLPAYFSSEYDKANEELGDLWTYRLTDKSRLAETTSLLKNISDPIVYALFALRATTRRRGFMTSSDLVEETFSMGTLSFIQSASSGLAEAVGRFAYVLDDVRQHCSEIMQFYRAFDVKPVLLHPAVSAEYKTMVRKSSDGLPMQGLSIRLDNVTFLYPGSERAALSQVSLEIEAGSLTCIVGYNGSGKSTLINLLTRMVDPAEGSVYINDVKAVEYRPSDLYARMTCQFQQTEPSDVTLREFLHMGDLGDKMDDDKMMACLAAAGIDKLVARFPKGLDARLGPYPADADPVSLLREVVDDNTKGKLDPWEISDSTEPSTTQSSTDDEDDDDEMFTVVGSSSLSNGGELKGRDCAFSPGEWQKLCFARTLMRKSADLRIFDEPSAALDPLASRVVFDLIQSLRGQSTVVHITHDLAACIRADKVIMFEDGKLIESGTHQELVDREESKYRAFYMAHTGQGDDEPDIECELTEDAEPAGSLSEQDERTESVMQMSIKSEPVPRARSDTVVSIADSGYDQ